jgi:hypothetical protein
MDDYTLKSDKPHSKYWEKIIEMARNNPEYKRKYGRRKLRRKTNEKLRHLKDLHDI